MTWRPDSRLALVAVLLTACAGGKPLTTLTCEQRWHNAMAAANGDAAIAQRLYAAHMTPAQIAHCADSGG